MYALYPDGVIDVVAEQAALETADRVVWKFPVYWYSVPVLLKAWEDVVVSYGWAYGTNGTTLHGKELMVAVSLGASAEKYQHDGSVHYTVNELLCPFQATSNLISATFLTFFVTAGAKTWNKDY